MNPHAGFDPGNEPQCGACEMHCGGPVPCLLAVELADDGELMTPKCCPEARCMICGGPLPCPSCLAALRCDAA